MSHSELLYLGQLEEKLSLLASVSGSSVLLSQLESAAAAGPSASTRPRFRGDGSAQPDERFLLAAGSTVAAAGGAAATCSVATAAAASRSRS